MHIAIDRTYSNEMMAHLQHVSRQTRDLYVVLKNPHLSRGLERRLVGESTRSSREPEFSSQWLH